MTIYPTGSVAGHLRKRRGRKWQKHYK